MIPPGYFSARVVTSASENLFVMTVEARKDVLSITLTDSDIHLTGTIHYDEFIPLGAKLKIGKDVVPKCIRSAIKAHDLVFKETENTLSFKLKHGLQTTQLSTNLTLLDNADEKADKNKTLLFLLAKQLHTESLLETEHAATSSPPLHMNMGYGPMPTSKLNKMNKVKRTAGMSIVNPSSKRVKKKPGINFNDDSDQSE